MNTTSLMSNYEPLVKSVIDIKQKYTYTPSLYIRFFSSNEEFTAKQRENRVCLSFQTSVSLAGNSVLPRHFSQISRRQKQLPLDSVKKMCSLGRSPLL